MPRYDIFMGSPKKKRKKNCPRGSATFLIFRLRLQELADPRCMTNLQRVSFSKICAAGTSNLSALQ